MSLNLTGLRVVADMDGETIYGVARVRYLSGHLNAGTYELERDGQPPILAPWDDCLPGPDWKDTPEERRFAGEEFYRPAFLDGTRRTYLSTGCGVIIPGDMDRLRNLIAKVTPGDNVNWYSYGANEFRGDLTVDSVDERGVTLSGPANAPKSYRWPDAEEFGPQYAHEFEITGTVLHVVRVPPKRTGKHQYRSLSLTFRRPAVY